jgi:N-acetylneuraminic acid mutarotase
MKYTILNLVFMLLIAINCFAQPDLTQKNRFKGSARVSASAAAVNGFGYIIGGFDSTGSKNDVWCYKPATDEWEQKQNFPGGARYGAVCVSKGNKLFYGTGLKSGNVFSKDFWEYNTDSDSWTQKADFPGAGRAYAVAFTIQNKIYLGTGTNGTGRYNDFWEYNPDSNTWRQKLAFAGLRRSNAVGFAIDNYGYVGTGTNGNQEYSDFFRFNPDSNTWTQIASIGAGGRTGATCFNIGNTAFIGLGVGDVIGKELLYYNQNKNTWHSLPAFQNLSSIGSVSFGIGNKAYVGIGSDTLFAALLSTFYEYNPSVVGVESHELAKSIKICPNPNNGSFQIDSETENLSDYNIEVLNHLGQIVYELGTQKDLLHHSLDIQMDSPNAGIYFVRISNANSFNMIKFIVW